MAKQTKPGNFGKQVSTLQRTYEKRLRATAKSSVQKTVQIAQTVVDDGGRMRVLTGFLWHSIAANIGALPAGESSPSAEDVYYTYTGSDVAATIIRWNLNEVLYIGWIANYAIYREHYDGFVKGATERWQETVTEMSMKANKLIK